MTEDVFNPFETLTNDQKKAIRKKLSERMKPPVIVLFGNTGSGKTSIVNAIFGKTVGRVGPVSATTKEANKYELSVDGKSMEIWDFPGLKDGRKYLDNLSDYEALYKSIAPQTDIVLHVWKASLREYEDALELHTKILSQYFKHTKRLLVLSQCDMAVTTDEPKWNDNYHVKPFVIQRFHERRKDMRGVLESHGYRPDGWIGTAIRMKYIDGHENMVGHWAIRYLWLQCMQALPDEKKALMYRSADSASLGFDQKDITPNIENKKRIKDKKNATEEDLGDEKAEEIINNNLEEEIAGEMVIEATAILMKTVIDFVLPGIEAKPIKIGIDKVKEWLKKTPAKKILGKMFKWTLS